MALTLVLLLGTLIGSLFVPIDVDARFRAASAPSSTILDRHGVLLYEIMDPHGGSQHTVTLDDVALPLRQAIIATEDASFYTNPGLSARGILRAIGINLRQGTVVSGASTITQQVARELLLGDARFEQSLSRKLHEAWLALRLTNTLTKDDILTLYLNETYFGNHAYGVEAAAHGYFGKPASELNLAESAMLAGLPQSPVACNPLTHPEAARTRQRTVLDLMVKAGTVTPEAADRAFREPLSYAGTPYAIRAPHFSLMVREELTRLVGEDAVSRGGLVVHTTLDWGLQQRAEQVVRQHLAKLNQSTESLPGHRVRNAAAVALDAEGAVRVLVGSPDYWDERIDGAVNATLALRQPGSALKPLTYAAAFEQGMSPATPVADVRAVFRTYEGNPYVPVNYDNQFHGLVSYREALASSYNVAAVRVLDLIGVQALPDMAHRLGIDTLNQPERQGLALTLGGAEVRLLDLAGAYASLAAAGQRRIPYLIERITDVRGDPLYVRGVPLPEQAVDARVAYLATHVLSDSGARAAAFGHTSALELPFPAAVKTGTTTEWRDNWTVGYSTEWTVGVWVGNADGSPMERVSGVTGAAPIWNSLMSIAHSADPVPFPVPQGLVRQEVCALSGLLPDLACPHRRHEWFLQENVPQSRCTLHSLATVDAQTGQPANADTPPERRVVSTLTHWPAEVLQWAIEAHLSDPEPAPETVAGPAVVRPGDVPYVTAPDDGAVYRLSSELPIEQQQLLIVSVCEQCEPGQRLIVRIDGNEWHSWGSPPYTVYWPLIAGDHTLVLAHELPDGHVRLSSPLAISVIADPSSGGHTP